MALELLVKESLELPGFWTLDRMASELRLEVNTTLFEQITGRMAQLEARRITSRIEAGETDDPSELAVAITGYRNLYEFLLEEEGPR